VNPVVKREVATVRLQDGTEMLAYRGRSADRNIVDRLVKAAPLLRRRRLSRAVARFLDEVQGDLIQAKREDVLQAIKVGWPRALERALVEKFGLDEMGLPKRPAAAPDKLGRPRGGRPHKVDAYEIYSYFEILRSRGLSAKQSVRKVAAAFNVTARHVQSVVSKAQAAARAIDKERASREAK